jgi:predicted nucleic acid-binding protein
VRYYYFDSSVLVQGYLWEEGTAEVLQVLQEARGDAATARIVTSRIAFPETMSAVARRERDQKLRKEEADELSNRISFDSHPAVGDV